MTQYVLSLDQGTTSSRAVLFDHDGKIAGMAQHEFPQHFPDTGWVEHDPMDILTTQINAAVEVFARAHIRPRDIIAIGIANQRETTIVWNRESGVPVYNAIVWQDRRTAEICTQLLLRHESLLDSRQCGGRTVACRARQTCLRYCR
jgi:glycerol kinase